MADLIKARERSVSNLQRLYIIVVSLAVAQSLKHLIEVISESGLKNFEMYYDEVLIFISFIFVMVPFFHGGNRYLDATYVTGERKAKKYALVIDFFVLFAEALLLFVLAMISESREAFYTVLVILLLLDILWVASTHFTTRDDTGKGPKFKKWAIVNCISVVAITVSVWSNLLNWEFWNGDLVKNVMLSAIVVCRTFYDYYSVWGFYYPVEEEYEIIPAPRPAPPPNP
jgi:hypothetical protein